MSCKRQRQSITSSVDEKNDGNADTEDAVQEIESVLSFAGTLSSKDEPVSRHIKEAIRKTKLHREMHPHSSDFRHGGPKDKLSNKLREQASESSRSNRYRVTWTRRALDLDLLDKGEESEKTSESAGSDNKENSKLPSTQSAGQCKNSGQDVLVSTFTTNSPAQIAEQKDAKLPPATKPAAPSALTKGDKMFCMFDVESDDEKEALAGLISGNDSSSGITMNGVPMVSTEVSAPLAESEYVYDLYYTHSNLSGLDVQAVLTVQSICDQFVNEEEEGPDGELVYDDEDDSNDESNWRNDYPDEDPHFFENDDGDCYYAEDMIDTNVLDDGDMLAQYLGSKCKVEADSDDDADEYGENEGSSDDEFM